MQCVRATRKNKKIKDKRILGIIFILIVNDLFAKFCNKNNYVSDSHNNIIDRNLGKEKEDNTKQNECEDKKENVGNDTRNKKKDIVKRKTTMT